MSRAFHLIGQLFHPRKCFLDVATKHFFSNRKNRVSWKNIFCFLAVRKKTSKKSSQEKKKRKNVLSIYREKKNTWHQKSYLVGIRQA